MKNSKKKIVILLQARMGSSRLPKKVMLDLCGQPVIWHIVNRLKTVPEVDEVVVASSINRENDILEEFCREKDIKCFRGSEDEVLDRFYKAATQYKADVMVRVTGDCPLIDPASISKLIRAFLDAKEPFDYLALATGAVSFKEVVNKFPDGTDTEIVSFQALEKAWNDARDPLDRGESVLSYIWRRPDMFKCGTIPFLWDAGEMRWTLDYEEDFTFITKIYEKLYKEGSCFSMMDVMEILKKEPHLTDINKCRISGKSYEKYYNDKAK